MMIQAQNGYSSNLKFGQTYGFLVPKGGAGFSENRVNAVKFIKRVLEMNKIDFFKNRSDVEILEDLDTPIKKGFDPIVVFVKEKADEINRFKETLQDNVKQLFGNAPNGNAFEIKVNEDEEVLVNALKSKILPNLGITSPAEFPYSRSKYTKAGIEYTTNFRMF